GGRREPAPWPRSFPPAPDPAARDGGRVTLRRRSLPPITSHRSRRLREAPVGSVRVAIVGVGNCASSLVQGVEYYKNAPEGQFIPGLMHPRVGAYHVGDIEFSAAFDIDERKVGRDLGEAIYQAPNNTVRFADVKPLGVPVLRGMTHDGLGHYLSQMIKKAPGSTADLAGTLP